MRREEEREQEEEMGSQGGNCEVVSDRVVNSFVSQS